jgi:hypothetical protein
MEIQINPVSTRFSSKRQISDDSKSEILKFQLGNRLENEYSCIQK